MRKNYVLAVCSRKRPRSEQDILVILKDRPASQAGKYNLPGGGIEEGETPEEAAIRELAEETGYGNIFEPVRCGVLTDRDFTIHVLRIKVYYPFSEINPREGETEKAEWIPLSELMKKPNLIPNLRVILPMALSNINGWTISDDITADNGAEHTLSITVPTYQ